MRMRITRNLRRIYGPLVAAGDIGRVQAGVTGDIAGDVTEKLGGLLELLQETIANGTRWRQRKASISRS